MSKTNQGHLNIRIYLTESRNLLVARYFIKLYANKYIYYSFFRCTSLFICLLTMIGLYIYDEKYQSRFMQVMFFFFFFFLFYIYRSGKYVYKPYMNKTCCPQYTIR